MEPGADKKKEQREITYRVGWRKERIEPHKASGAGAHGAFAEEHGGQRRLRLLWQATPALPEASLLPLLAALPVLLFLLTLLLVYGLRSV